MKLAPVILVLSVAANLGLAGWLYLRTTASAPGETTPQVDSLIARETIPEEAALRPDPSLKDEAYVTELRRAGCPPVVLRALMLTRLRARIEEQLRSLPRGESGAYWKSDYLMLFGLSREARAKARELYRQLELDLKRLVGEDDHESYRRASRERSMAYLASGKVQEVEAINRDYSELMNEVRQRSRGLMLPADREELQLLEREQRADLAAALTPEELLEYDLRSGPTAAAMRQKLTYFQPTEAEYLALVKLQLEIDQIHGRGSLPAAAERQRRQAESALADRIAASLGPERYAEFELTTDPRFRGTDQFLRAYGFDTSMTREVVGLQRGFNERANQIRREAGADRAKRDAALTALADEASRVLTVKLGSEVMPNFERSAGTWLKQLRPQTRPPANPSIP